MIYTHVPYRLDANLGRAYNSFMELLGADDWAIFLDHDAMPTTGLWFRQFSEAIEFMPDAGAFVAMTNRSAALWQCCGDKRSNDIAWHRSLGAERTKLRTLLDVSDTKGWAGVMFAIGKAAWMRCGGFADGFGCVDHSIHFRLRDVGMKVWMLESVYVYHWRHFGELDPTSQHPKAENCPCRGPEATPTARIALPPLCQYPSGL